LCSFENSSGYGLPEFEQNAALYFDAE